MLPRLARAILASRTLLAFFLGLMASLGLHAGRFAAKPWTLART